jgi:hypothetical protein
MSLAQHSVARVWPVWLPKVAQTGTRSMTREASSFVGADSQTTVPGVPMKTRPAKEIFDANQKKVYTTLYANSHYPTKKH